MNKGKLARITAIFFAFMLCFTVLSRAADQAGVAAVVVARPENMMITHTVKTTGKVVQNQELAVATEPEQRVTGIYVSEGDRVQKGDVLFEVDMDDLQEAILYQQQELEKQELTVEDLKSQKDVSAQQKASQIAQAQEQYSLSAKSASVQLSRAKEALSEAKKALADFRDSNGISSDDGAVEAALEQAVEEKSAAYISAQDALSQLQWKIENAVDEARKNAQNRASLTGNGSIYTQSAEKMSRKEDAALTSNGAIYTRSSEEDEILEGTEQMNLNSGNLDVAWDDAGLIAEESGTVSGDGGDFDMEIDLILPEDEGFENSGTGADNSGINSNNSGINSDNNGINADNNGTNSDYNGTGSGSSGTDSGSSAPLSEAELNQVEQSVRSIYSQELAAAKQKVQTALEEKNEAETALAQYQQERLASAESKAAQSEEQLIANVKTAQQAYEDAAIAANEAAVTNGRAVQSASIPDASNSSDRMNEITYEQMELALKKLEALKEADGKILSPADGLITKINITTGEKTTDGTAVLMADITKGYRFTAEITKDQEQYIGTGDLVTLTGSNGKQKLEELAVESVVADETDTEVYHVTVQLPEDSFEIGASVTLEYSKKSAAYSICVPLSALHLDEKNQTYVLVPEEYDSIMGTEIRARKVSVNIQEKNESYAALAEGAITSQQQVITSSDKSIDNGSKVRISEQ